MALPTISETNDAAVRAATRDLAVRRGMDRVMALHGRPNAPGNPCGAVGRPDTATSTTSTRRDAERLGLQQAVINGRAGHRASPARREGKGRERDARHERRRRAAESVRLGQGTSAETGLRGGRFAKRLAQHKGRYVTLTGMQTTILALAEIDPLLERVRAAAERTTRAIGELIASESHSVEILRQMKFTEMAWHPIDDRPLNLIEQLNQTGPISSR